MDFGILSIIHIVAAVFAIIELGLTANDVSAYHDLAYLYYPSPSQVNFMLFNSIWSLLVLAYIGITPLYMTHLFHRLASVALEAVTTIFWFAGSIALAAAIDCSGGNFCGSVKASVAFGFFLWALFAALLVLDAIELMRSRRGAAADTPHHKTQPYAGA